MKKESAINLVLSLAKQRRENKTNWCGGFHIDKSIIEFCQSKGEITYKEMRSIASTQTKIKKTQADLIKSLEAKLKYKGFLNWVLSHWENKEDQRGDPEFFPQSLGENGAIISHKEEVIEILNQDEELFKKNESFRVALSEFTQRTCFIYDWINQLFIRGTLEDEIVNYLKKKETKKTQARLSKVLVGNFLEPEITNAVEEIGEPPTLSTSERQTVQFLLWKADNMNETEKRLKDRLLDGKGDTKRNGVCVCFEEKEAILNTYGKTTPDGFHYNEIKTSLKTLSEKNRKLVLKNEKEEIKISVPLIKKVDFEHRFINEPEFKKYVVVYLDMQISDLGEKYTSFPGNHFALLRHTPPKTPKLTEGEIKFFDIIFQGLQTLSKINTSKKA